MTPFTLPRTATLIPSSARVVVHLFYAFTESDGKSTAHAIVEHPSGNTDSVPAHWIVFREMTAEEFKRR